MATEDYFSINDILASEPRFMATFRVRGHQLGHLDPMGVHAAIIANPSLVASSTPRNPTPTQSTHDDDNASNDQTEAEDVSSDQEDEALRHIPVNHRLALPFWLAETLMERNLITVHLPHCFRMKVRHELRADAPSVSLFSKCPTYYALGIRVSKLVKDPALPVALARAFANRCWGIVDQAGYSSSRGSKALAKLDKLERKLFFTAHAVSNSVIRWKERSFDRICAFQSILGKRPRSMDPADSDVTSAATPPSASRVRRF